MVETRVKAGSSESTGWEVNRAGRACGDQAGVSTISKPRFLSPETVPAGRRARGKGDPPAAGKAEPARCAVPSLRAVGWL